MSLGGRCCGCVLEGVRGRCLRYGRLLGAGCSKALGKGGKCLLLLGTVTGQTRAHMAQHKGFFSPLLTYAAPQWLFPNTCHGLGLYGEMESWKERTEGLHCSSHSSLQPSSMLLRLANSPTILPRPHTGAECLVTTTGHNRPWNAPPSKTPSADQQQL